MTAEVAGIGVVAVLGATGCGSGDSGRPGAAQAAEHRTLEQRTSSGAAAVASEAPFPVENNPPGYMLDNPAFVPYANAAGGYSFAHPEGWAQTDNGATVGFTASSTE